MSTPPSLFLVPLLLALAPTPAAAADAPIRIDTPMPPPEWAYLERALLDANTQAIELFRDRYFDPRGYALCVERWGGDDGPDDASESFGQWPLLHALGAPSSVARLHRELWEGHLRQYTQARTTEVPFARDGMYFKEFPVMFDWLHHGEGLRPFFLHPLSEPDDNHLRLRTARYLSFYDGTDPTAPNYDPTHRVMRSLINGSRGPMLRKATALDWAGDPIEIEGRFAARHGERNYQEMLAHFEDYNDVAGDHPQNLVATTLGLNAFALTADPKARDWVVSYVDAWRQRMQANGNVMPSNVGPDGTAGGAANGKWYGGVYGWGFTVRVPQTGELANRNTTALGLVGFGNALLLTGNTAYIDAWRSQIEAVNSHEKMVDGRPMWPSMHGDDGWYGFLPSPYSEGALEVYYWSMNPADRERLGQPAWLSFLEGKDPTYPAAALRRDLEAVRARVAAIRADTTTPDTRLSDDIAGHDPVAINSLTELMLGGLPTGNARPVLHARLRYFDPEARRPGLPPGVAALVEKLGPDSATLSLINLDPIHEHAVTIQGGAFGEHALTSAQIGDQTAPTPDGTLTVTLAPGCGSQLTLAMKRYTNPPTARLPWQR